jgi:signal transduction histidine kinase
MLISALLFSIYTSNKRKQKLQQSYIAALQQEREIMQLKAIMQGEEKERIRIARELHDGIMVQFSSVKMNLSA